MKKRTQKVVAFVAGVVVAILAALASASLITDVLPRRALSDMPHRDVIERYEAQVRAARAAQDPAAPSPALLLRDKLALHADVRARVAAAFAEGEPLSELLTEFLNGNPSTFDTAFWEAQRPLLEQYADLIALVQAAAGVDGPMTATDLSVYEQETDLEYYNALWHMGKLLQLSALCDIAGGDTDRFIVNVRSMLLLAQAMGKEPYLQSQQHRLSFARTAAETLGLGPPGDQLGHNAVSTLAAFAPDPQACDTFAASFVSETSRTYDRMDRIAAGETGLMPGAVTATMEGYSMLCRTPFGKPLLDFDKTATARQLGHAAELAAMPYYEARTHFDELSDVGRLQFITASYAGNLAIPIAIKPWADAELDVALLGLAIEQYQAEDGDLPPTLDAVAQEVLGRAPIDPFSGEPYVYRPAPDGTFQLYSVSMNGKDDNANHDLREGDIVWRGVD